MRQATMSSPHVATLRDYLAVVRRRKWVIITSVIVVPLAALAFSLTQSAKYQATAKVLVSSQDLVAELTGTQPQGSTSSNELQTQAELARVPTVAQGAIRALHLSMAPGAFLAATDASASATSNILTFTATSADRQLASQMATAYARAYVHYRFRSETAPIEAARRGLETRIAQAAPGSVRDVLIEKEQALAETAALMTNDASVVKVASGAGQTAPRVKRNVALGFILGLFLGVGLAFLRETLDTRVRSAEEIGELLELPLLARLPEPPKRLRDVNHLAMIDEPDGLQAETFRMLRTNIEFVALGKDVKTIMVTSAVEREGKSTTIANLAASLARSGKRVVLVDLDLRRPFVAKFFGLEGHAGVTDVALGRVKLDEALVPILLPKPQRSDLPSGSLITNSGQVKLVTPQNGNGHGPVDKLVVLPSGPIPPDPGEFVGTDALAGILDDLRSHADIVLIDAPPLFHVGDALVLSARVDAIFTVTRMDVVRRPMLTELSRLLERMPASKLGFVVTGAESADDYSYGYGGYYYGSPEPERTPERTSVA